MESIKDRIYFAARRISDQTMTLAEMNIPSEKERCLSIYAEAWENGEKFYVGDVETAMEKMSIMLGMAKRGADCDEEKEIEAAAEQLVSALRKANVKHWLFGITREQMVAVGNALGRDAFVSYSDEQMSATDMARKWNEIHEGEKEIIICTGDMLP